MPGAAILCDTTALVGHGAILRATILDAAARSFPVHLHPILYAFQGSQYQGSDVVHLDPIWTRLAAPMEAGDTSIQVTRTLGFPDAGPFELVIGRECLLVSGDMTGLTWSVARAQRGTRAVKHYPRAMVSALPHTIVVTNDATVWDYTARWGYPNAFNVKYACPGGPSEAVWTVVDYGATGPATLTAAPTLGSPVVISDAYGPYWIGVVDEVYPDFRVNGATVQIVARGWAVMATDQRYATSKTFGPTIVHDSQGQIVYTNFSLGVSNPDEPDPLKWKPILLPEINPLQAIHQICEIARLDLASASIAAGDYRGGDSAFPNPSGDMIGRTALEIWNEMTQHGESDGTPVYWYVRGHPEDPGHPYLDIIDRDDVASLQIAMRDLPRAGVRWRRSDVQNQVLMRYAGGLVADSNSAGITDLGGAVRQRWVDGASQLLSGALAAQTAHTIVGQSGRVTPALESLTVPYPRRVLDLHGNPVPLWRSMVGQVVVVGDIDSGNTKLRGLVEGFFIKEQLFDFTSRAATFQSERVWLLADATGRYLQAESQRFVGKVHTVQPLNIAPPLGDARSSTGRGIGAPSSPGQNYPSGGSGSGSADASGTTPYLGLPEGADTFALMLGIGDGVNTDTAAVGMFKEGQLPWLTQFYTGEIALSFPDGPQIGTVEVQVSLMNFIATGTGLTLTPLYRIRVDASRHGQTLQTVPSTGNARPEEIFLSANSWLRFTIIETDGKASNVSVTLRGQKHESVAALPPGPPPTDATVAYISGTFIGVITVDLPSPAAVRFNFGDAAMALDENGQYGSWLSSQDMISKHRLQVPILASGTYTYTLLAQDEQGQRTAFTGTFDA